MSIGATTGKEPDHVDDADLLSLDEMREAMKDLSAAALTNVERATVRGVLVELDIVKGMMGELEAQNARLVNLYTGMKNEFDQFRAQRAMELISRGGGSTTPGE